MVYLVFSYLFVWLVVIPIMCVNKAEPFTVLVTFVFAPFVVMTIFFLFALVLIFGIIVGPAYLFGAFKE